jgi:hypothetical protein
MVRLCPCLSCVVDKHLEIERAQGYLLDLYAMLSDMQEKQQDTTRILTEINRVEAFLVGAE